MLTSLPNLLTLSRIIVIPIIIGLFFVREHWAAWTACVLFAIQVSLVGKFLDPIADKLLVAAVLFMLVAVDKLNGISVLPAVVILLREVLVSGLREFLAGIRVGMPVSKLAKWKTAIQMVALGILIVGNDGPPWLPVEAIGVVGLWAAGLLTLITGWDYMQAGWKHMNEEREPEPEPTPRPAQPHGTGAARSVG
jgi:cardiolipin synthase